jgi:prolyl-tRNA synthetase
VKFKDSELIGIPTILVVGRGLATGTVEIKDRRSGERREVAVDDVVAALTAEVTAEVERS